MFKSCSYLEDLQASRVVSPYLFRKRAIWRDEYLIEAWISIAGLSSYIDPLSHRVDVLENQVRPGMEQL